MKKKTIFKLSSILVISFILLLTPIAIYADETDILSEEQTAEETEQVVEQEETNEEEQEERSAPSTNTENQSDDNTKAEATSTPIEEHKVAVITTKVDQDGNPLSGAVLQILDENGNVVDEWTSDGTEHTTLLPEGNYVLHEESAPEGYKPAEDKPFTVKVEVADLDAGVDFSETPCPHYGGTPLYYVEIEGEKYEVYCINQDWETPDENSTYDGAILNPDDIRNYTQQTVYVDAEKNKDKIDVSDQSLTSEELYNKLLDIIYHRELASSIFTDLTEAEIRYVTESALKNYTNAGLTRVQGVRKLSGIPEGVTDWAYYSGYYWYLYTHFRSFIYNPDAPLGTDIFTTSVGNGDAFGALARHWSDPAIVNGIITGHNAKNNQAVRDKIARFYELYQYLISNSNPHPSDMHLYIYSSSSMPTDLSGNDFDGVYQNLLGITWYNQNDKKHTVTLELVNEKEEPKREYKNPQTGDNTAIYMVMLSLSLCGLAGGLFINKKEF